MFSINSKLLFLTIIIIFAIFSFVSCTGSSGGDVVPIEKPVIISPENNASELLAPITLDWSGSLDFYTLMYSNDYSDLQNLTGDVEQTTLSEKVLNLTEGTWFWQVKGKKNDVDSPYTDIHTFSVGFDSPPVPEEDAEATVTASLSESDEIILTWPEYKSENYQGDYVYYEYFIYADDSLMGMRSNRLIENATCSTNNANFTPPGNTNRFRTTVLAKNGSNMQAVVGEGSFSKDKAGDNHPPVNPYGPKPSKRENGVALNPSLSWKCYDPDGNALEYDVYFGEAVNDMELVAEQITEQAYNPGQLKSGQEYFWRIIVRESDTDKQKEKKSPIWSFETMGTDSFRITVQSTPSIAGDVRIEKGKWGYKDSEVVEQNEQVTIEYREDKDYTFAGWYEQDQLISEDNEIEILVNEDKAIIARFIKKGQTPSATYTITVESSPVAGGFIRVNSRDWNTEETIMVEENEEVTIEASSNNDYTFEGWQSDNSVISEVNPYTFLADADEIINAVFTPIPNASPTVQKVEGPDGEINENMTTFEWSGTDEAGSRAIAKYQYMKDDDTWVDMNPLTATTYTWNEIAEGEHTFEIKAIDDEGAESNILLWEFSYSESEYTLTIEASPSVGGDVSFDNTTWSDNVSLTVEEGTEVNAYAQAAQGYTFVSWTKDGVEISTNANFTYTMTSYETELVANFTFSYLEWKFETGNYIYSSPAIGSDGTVYIGSTDHFLYALNPDGSLKWKFETGAGIYSSPAIGKNGTIYVGSFDRKVYALNQDGTQKWHLTTDGEIVSSPAIGSDGTVYIGSIDGFLYALNPDGSLKWKYKMGKDIYYSSPAIGNDGIIYIESTDGFLYAVNPDGSLKWKFEAHNFVLSSPTIGSDGTIYVGFIDNNLHAFNKDGTEKWEAETGGLRASPTIGSDGTIYVGSENKTFCAVNPDGSLKWKFETEDINQSSPAIGNDGRIYFGSYDGYIYAIKGECDGLSDSVWPKFRQNNKNTGRDETAIQLINLTIEASPTEGGTVSDGGSYETGTEVTIQATPNTGYEFVSWTKDGNEISTSADYTYEMPDENVTLVANFEMQDPPVEPTISTMFDPAPEPGNRLPDSFDIFVSATHPDSELVYLKAELILEGSEEKFWSKEATSTGSQKLEGGEQDLTVDLGEQTERNIYLYVLVRDTDDSMYTSEEIYTVYKTIDEYTLTIEASPSEGGDVSFDNTTWSDSASKTVEEGTEVDIYAQSSDGYTFEDWYDDGVLLTQGNPDTLVLDSDKTIKAWFEEIPNTVPIIEKVDGPDEGQQITVNSATFEWSGTDESQARMITKYQFKEDDGSWEDMNPLTATTYTWNNISEEDHTFSVRAVDDDGAYSETINWSFYYKSQILQLDYLSGKINVKAYGMEDIKRIMFVMNYDSNKVALGKPLAENEASVGELIYIDSKNGTYSVDISFLETQETLEGTILTLNVPISRKESSINIDNATIVSEVNGEQNKNNIINLIGDTIVENSEYFSFGGSDMEYCEDIVETSNGDFIVAGRTTSNDDDVSGNHGMSDAWIVKIDQNGNKMWAKCYGRSGGDSVYDIEETSDRTFIICGSSSGNFWILKIDEDGNELFSKYYNRSQSDIAYNIEEVSDGGFIIAGSTEKRLDYNKDYPTKPSYWILKIDKDGNELWSKFYGGYNTDKPCDIEEIGTGGFIVAGWTSSNTHDVSGNHGIPPNYNADYWILKLDEDGNKLWAKCFGGSEIDIGKSIEETNDGGFIVAGWTECNNFDVSGNHGEQDVWILKIDEDGNKLWAKCFGGSEIDRAYDLEKDEDGGFLITGYSYSENCGISELRGDRDYWVLKIDHDGNEEWAEYYGGSESEISASIEILRDGGFIVAGHSDSEDYDVSENKGGSDYWIVKVNN